MDIRIKISLTLVLVSLVSMFILASAAYQVSSELLQQFSVRQLNALAESKKRDLQKVHTSWEDKLRLIRNRTPLQESLRHFLDSGNETARLHIQRIIEDATTAVDEVDRITVFDVEGTEIASFGRVAVAHPFVVPEKDIAYVGSFPSESGSLRVALTSAVSLDGQVIGGIEMIVDSSSLFDVTSNYTGLGETGEVMLVKRKDDQTYMVLNPLRHDKEAVLSERSLADASADIRAVLESKEAEFTQLKDYRGVQVWSATRYLPELKWGLLVKVDKQEEAVHADVLQSALFDTAVALSAFAIIGGALLGFALARPIHEMVVVVEKMREGDMSARVAVKGDDEIAYLAESINELLDHLESENRTT